MLYETSKFLSRLMLLMLRTFANQRAIGRHVIISSAIRPRGNRLALRGSKKVIKISDIEVEENEAD